MLSLLAPLNGIVQKDLCTIQDGIAAHAGIGVFFVTPDDLRSKICADYQNEIHTNLTAYDEAGSWIETQYDCRVSFSRNGRSHLANKLALQEFINQTGDSCLV